MATTRQGEPPYAIKSFMKLYVTQESDDKGIAFISQIIMSGTGMAEFAELKYRVKFGSKEGELTRSVKHKDDAIISKVIAKL